MQGKDLGQLKRLAIFATVVQEKSFSQAAKLLAISRSTVSEQVALLEEELSLRLLQRTTRKLQLTSDGDKLFPQAKLIYSTFNQIKETTQQDKAEGRVRIATNHDIACQWLQPKLASLNQKFPNIYFDFQLSEKNVDIIAEQVDIAIRLGTMKDDSVVVRPIVQDRPQIIASKYFLKQYGKPKAIEELTNYPWVLLPQIHQENRVTLFRQQEKKYIKPQHFHRCDSPIGMLNMVQSGMGLGVYLPMMLPDTLEELGLEMLFKDWYSSDIVLSVIYPSRKQIPVRVRCVIDFLLNNEY